jgi:hypothetical protein
MISESIRMKNSPDGGKDAAEVIVMVATDVLPIAPFRVEEPS